MVSLGSRVLEGLNISLIGMTITISSLILLSVTITLMSKVIKTATNKTAGGAGARQNGGGAALQGNAAGLQPGPSSNDLAGAVDEAGGGIGDNISGGVTGELIAVFTAAITQFTGNAAGSFRVVSYRRTGRSSPAWNLRGRDEYLTGKNAVQNHMRP